MEGFSGNFGIAVSDLVRLSNSGMLAPILRLTA